MVLNIVAPVTLLQTYLVVYYISKNLFFFVMEVAISQTK